MDLFSSDNPITSDWDNLEVSLKSMLDPAQISFVKAKIESAEAARPKGVSPSVLFKVWVVYEKLARGAIEQNIQLCRHSSDNILSRQYTTNDRMLRYKRLKSIFAMKHKSVREYTCCQVFVSDKGFVAVYPMRSQEEFRTALHWFCKQVGVPMSLIVDGHRSQKSPMVKRF